MLHGDYVGGSPESIESGGAKFAAVGRSVQSRVAGVNQVGTSGTSVGSAVAPALARFVAAFSTYAHDASIAAMSLGTLAANTSADLSAAGGGGS